MLRSPAGLLAQENARLWLLLPGLVAVALYWRAIGFGLVWDDEVYLGELPIYRDWTLLWRSAFAAFGGFYFRPLALLTLGLEQILSHGNPVVSHLGNILFHAANSVLTAALGVLLAQRAGAAPRTLLCSGLACGLLYAVHPSLMEAAAWISARFDLMATTFFLLGLVLDRVLRGATVRLLAVSLCFLCAALCKEMALTFVLILPLWQGMFAAGATAQARRDDRRVAIATVVAAAIYLGMRWLALGNLVEAPGELPYGDVLGHAALVCKCFYKYLALAAYPFTQICPVHPYATPVTFADAQAQAGLACLLIAAGLLAYGLRRNDRWRLLLLFAISLLPVLQIVPLTINDNYVHERFMALPLAFAGLWAGSSLTALWQAHPNAFLRRAAAAAGAAAWMLLAVLIVTATLPVWRDSLSLWTWSHQQAPESALARANLQAAYFSNGLLDQALDLSRLAETSDAMPLSAEERFTYAQTLRQLGQPEAALAQLQKAAALAPARTALLAHVLLQSGAIFLDAGDFSNAKIHLQQSIHYQPYSADANCLLGIALIALGETAPGQALLRQGLLYAGPGERAELDVYNHVLLAKTLRRRDEMAAAPARQR